MQLPSLNPFGITTGVPCIDGATGFIINRAANLTGEINYIDESIGWGGANSL